MRKSVFRRSGSNDGSESSGSGDFVANSSAGQGGTSADAKAGGSDDSKHFGAGSSADGEPADGIDGDGIESVETEEIDLDDEEIAVTDTHHAAEVEDPASVQAEQIARLEAEVKENYDKYLRALAEMENTKKRALKERADLIRYAGENLARDLLEIADNFQLAFAQDLSGVPEQFSQGFRLICDRFTEILNKYEVRPESALGTAFDPAKQQALTSIPTNDHPPGTVIEEFKKAYFFKDKLLRPGQVVVAVQPPAPKPEVESASE